MHLMIQLTAFKNEGDPVKPVATIVVYNIDAIPIDPDNFTNNFTICQDATAPTAFFITAAADMLQALADQANTEEQKGSMN